MSIANFYLNIKIKKLHLLKLVLNGVDHYLYGSAFFGKKARIIGIDLDPSAKELEKFGFEIFIGDQSSNKILG